MYNMRQTALGTRVISATFARGRKCIGTASTSTRICFSTILFGRDAAGPAGCTLGFATHFSLGVSIYDVAECGAE